MRIYIPPYECGCPGQAADRCPVHDRPMKAGDELPLEHSRPLLGASPADPDDAEGPT